MKIMALYKGYEIAKKVFFFFFEQKCLFNKNLNKNF